MSMQENHVTLSELAGRPYDAPRLHSIYPLYLRYSYSLCYASILNFYFTFKYKLALTMALYEGFDMTFVKMPKYLPTNKYQN